MQLKDKNLLIYISHLNNWHFLYSQSLKNVINYKIIIYYKFIKRKGGEVQASLVISARTSPIITGGLGGGTDVNIRLHHCKQSSCSLRNLRIRVTLGKLHVSSLGRHDHHHDCTRNRHAGHFEVEVRVRPRARQEEAARGFDGRVLDSH